MVDSTAGARSAHRYFQITACRSFGLGAVAATGGWRVLRILTVVVLLACDGDSGALTSRSPRTTVAISADQLNSPRKLILSELHRVGDRSDGLGYTFGEISSAALAKDGSLYVADAVGSVIAVFDSSGVTEHSNAATGEHFKTGQSRQWGV
jgi:hypothetical protein